MGSAPPHLRYGGIEALHNLEDGLDADELQRVEPDEARRSGGMQGRQPREPRAHLPGDAAHGAKPRGAQQVLPEDEVVRRLVPHLRRAAGGAGGGRGTGVRACRVGAFSRVVREQRCQGVAWQT